MSRGWTREDQADLAAGRILDAAGKAFGVGGVSAAGMAEIADAAGCSRGTLYRYFPNRHALHLAYVKREARRIVTRVREEAARVEHPRARLVAIVLGSIRQVRENPGTAAWFAPGASELAARMSQAPEVMAALTEAFVAESTGRGRRGRDRALRARWLVRVIVSLLASPGESEAEERALVERFVAPVLVPDPD